MQDPVFRLSSFVYERRTRKEQFRAGLPLARHLFFQLVRRPQIVAVQNGDPVSCGGGKAALSGR